MPDFSSSDQGALVLFSGGQDSTACLAWALERYARVETVGFDYGQRHAIELTARRAVRRQVARRFPGWRARLGPDHKLNLRAFGKIGETALTSARAIEITDSGLPSTFVPGRNLVFLTYAAALADRRGLTALIGGMCETDYSGYPDCRDDAIKAMQVALNLGMATRLVVETPLMWIDKAATWRLARDLGGETLVDIVREVTHTCYEGDRSRRHEWGFGCGHCPACALRAAGYAAFRAAG